MWSFQDLDSQEQQKENLIASKAEFRSEEMLLKILESIGIYFGVS